MTTTKGNYFKVPILLCILLFSVGCSSARYITKARSAEGVNSWPQAVKYYEKAHRKSLVKTKTAKLLNQSKKNAAYYYYREALYAVEQRGNFLEDQRKALDNIHKALAYKPDEKDYMTIQAKITQSIDRLNLRVKSAFDTIHESIRNNEFLDALSQCDAVLYIDPHNSKAVALKEDIRKKGSEYYLKEALNYEKNGTFNTAIQFLEYSNEIKKNKDWPLFFWPSRL